MKGSLPCSFKAVANQADKLPGVTFSKVRGRLSRSGASSRRRTVGLSQPSPPFPLTRELVLEKTRPAKLCKPNGKILISRRGAERCWWHRGNGQQGFRVENFTRPFFCVCVQKCRFSSTKMVCAHVPNLSFIKTQKSSDKCRSCSF